MFKLNISDVVIANIDFKIKNVNGYVTRYSRNIQNTKYLVPSLYPAYRPVTGN